MIISKTLLLICVLISSFLIFDNKKNSIEKITFYRLFFILLWICVILFVIIPHIIFNL